MATGGYSDLERDHDETFNFLCTFCQVNNKTTEAEKFCTQCDDYFCSSCFKIHEIPGLKYHKVLDKSQFKSGASVMVQAVPTETCKHHGHKPVDMFCEQHDKVGCFACMVIDHSECKKKFFIPGYIKKKKTAVKTSDISAHLDTLRNSIQELQKVLNDDDRKLRTSRDALINQIKQLRKEINQRLDDLEKNTMKIADTAFQSLLDSVQSKMKKLQWITAEIHFTQDSLKRILGNQAQLFINLKQAKNVVSRATEIVETTLGTYPSPTVSFSADQKLQSLLQEMEVLGSVNTTESKHVSKQAAEININKLKTKQMPSLLKIKGKEKNPVKLSSDTGTCNIVSACVLDDDTVILADFNSNTLKCLNSSTYRVRDSCYVPEVPWQVCVISQQEVAVSCGGSKLIQFVSVGSSMCCTRQIHTDFMCYGLACADGKLYVSDDTSVYMYTVSGERLHQFSIKDQTGKYLFSYINSLAVSSDSSRIYVADWNKGLIIHDTSGKFVSQYNGPQLDRATDVCLYKNDSVLVCDSKNVLQFTADGQLVGEVLKTDGSSRALCWEEKNSKLIVTSRDIDIYDINTEL